MAGLIPFNRRNSSLTHTDDRGFEDFYNMLDDFFTDSWFSGRNLLRDSFKIDIQETDMQYCVMAELPGIRKEEIDLNIEDDNLCISVNRSEEKNEDSGSYIHRERRSGSMIRRIRLANAKLDEAKAKLEDGILTVTIPKEEKQDSLRKIEIE